ncbi:MAG: DUF975 family protein [Lachnospiraceae bacterium]|nr:DUF975 family protein [Lachnospiraceae bacterium]
MYINRLLLKNNARKTLSKSYWSCVLAGLVMALAAGDLGSSPSPGRYNVNDIIEGGFSGESIYRYDTGDLFGGMFGSLNIPAYMIGTSISILTIAIVVSALLTIFLLQPLEVGCRKFFIDAGKEDYNLADLGEAFSASYTNVVKIMFLRQLYIFLWALLFIIPGIIKAYEYRMVPYILAENPGISDQEAFMESRRIMTGSKFDAFIFDLSFLGWFLLDAVTLGAAGIFFVNPYYYSACAGLYEFLKTKPAYYSGQYSGQPEYGQPEYGQYEYKQPEYGQPEYGQIPEAKEPDSTVPADDAKPFNTPYGQ